MPRSFLLTEDFFIDRYRVTAELGAGGHGRVYLGLDPKLDREVAIKVVLPELTSDAAIMSRFHREARAIAKLHHPNILEIYDYSGPDSELGYLIVERLRGKNLHQLVSMHGPLDPGTAAACAHEICLALKHAHEQGIVHRDLKPENVFLEPSGRVVLCDFGIARSFDKNEGTLSGGQTEMMGTPLFMSPEQITDPGAVTGASDIFSLGSVLYFLVSGELAFRAKTIVELLKKIVIADYTPLLSVRADVGEDFAAIVDRCLQVSAEERFHSAADAAKALFGVMQRHGFSDPRAALEQSAQALSTATPTRPRPIDVNDALTRTLLESPTLTRGTITGEQNGQTTVVHAGERHASTPRTAPTTSTERHRAPRPRGGLYAGLALSALVLGGGGALLIGKLRTKQEVHTIAIDDPPPAAALSTALTPPAPLPTLPPSPPPTAPPSPPPEAKHEQDEPRESKRTSRHEPAREAKPAVKETPAPKPAAPAAPGILRLVALPWADVYVDDRKVGTTPIFRTLPLPAGKHTLKLVNPGLPTVTKAFDVPAGESLELKFDLRK